MSAPRLRPSTPPAPGRRGAVTAAAAILSLSLALLLSACSMATRSDPSQASPRNEMVALQVDNQNFKDARIYVHWNSGRERVGTVGGKTEHTFRFRGKEGNMRVEVSFIAGGGFVTDALHVWSGETVRLVIPPNADE